MTLEMMRKSTLTQSIKKGGRMNASIRFFIEDIENNNSLQKLIEQASCSRSSGKGYVQFSDKDGFLALQPQGFLSEDLLIQLDELATRVTLRVVDVKTEAMISFLNPQKDFSVEIGDIKVSGLDLLGDYRLLFTSTSSKKVFGAFKKFAPGIFINRFAIIPFLTPLGWWERIKFVFGF